MKPRFNAYVLALRGLAVLAATAVLAFKYMPDWFASDVCRRRDQKDCLGATAQAADRRSVTTASLALLAGGLGIFGALVSAMTLQHNRQADAARHALDQDRQITERFTRAIDQIGNPQLEVQLGGIYALERIARDSADDHPQVVEVLVAYVRSRAGWDPNSDKPPEWAPIHPSQLPQPTIDLHAALAVLARRRCARRWFSPHIG